MATTVRLTRDSASFVRSYNIYNTNAAAAQIEYTAVDPLGAWYLPAHEYQRTFSSANGLVSIQVVSMDSTPLHDRYLYSGSSGGSFATSFGGVYDGKPPGAGVNDPAAAIVINPGVTAANGYTNGN